MRKSLSISVVALLLVAAGACKSGPPSISELKTGKTKDVAQTASAFDAKDTIYAVANIANPPKGGKITGRLIVVNVEGQQPGPIPGLETSMTLAEGLNVGNFEFSAPTAGWPNGQYQLEVVLADDKGEQKDKKTADFSTSGNAPAAPAADTAATDSTATDTAADDTAADETTTQ